MEPISRRQILGYAGLGAGAVGFGLAAGACADDRDDRTALVGSRIYPFRGVHQAGVTAPQAAAGIVLGLDLRVEDRAQLEDTFVELSASIEQIMSGAPYEARDGGFPAQDSGVLGEEPGATGTAVVVGYGDSLFDERFSLADRKPLELQPMPRFGNDYLVRDETSHGDLSITVSADTNDAALNAVRQILRDTRGRFVPRWSREGYADLIPGADVGEAPMRNLMGFKDGTANLDHADEDVMDRHVWIQPDDGQPEWAVGGTYQAIRVIRMQIEFWDRTRLNEQEAIFGRHRGSGAPLGTDRETDTPLFGADLDSHIARANPRTPGSEENLILRKGFNYASGFDQNDQLDQGLLFMCFQRSLEKGFITVQSRLDGEVLEEYIRPVGGGVFFCPPAPADGEFLGERLLA